MWRPLKWLGKVDEWFSTVGRDEFSRQMGWAGPVYPWWAVVRLLLLLLVALIVWEIIKAMIQAVP